MTEVGEAVQPLSKDQFLKEVLPEKDIESLQEGLRTFQELLDRKSSEELPTDLVFPDTSGRAIFWLIKPVIENKYKNLDREIPDVHFVSTPGNSENEAIKDTSNLEKRIDEVIEKSQGKNFLIVDDYSITGTTLKQLGETIKKGGDLNVEAFVFMHGYPKSGEVNYLDRLGIPVTTGMEDPEVDMEFGPYNSLGFAFRDPVRAKFRGGGLSIRPITIEHKAEHLGVEKRGGKYVIKSSKADSKYMRWFRQRLRAVGEEFVDKKDGE